MLTEQILTKGSTKLSYQSHLTKNISTNQAFDIVGSWQSGWSLDLHTIRSTKTDHGWDTDRTLLGQALYDLKYKDKKENVEFLAHTAAEFLFNSNILHKLNVVIPVPFSKERAFQPVYEVAKVIGQKIGVNTDLKYVYKNNSSEMKNVLSRQKKDILGRSIQIASSRYKGQNVLLFDDLFCSGSTLAAVSKALKRVGRVKNIYALTLTKTRTKQ